MAALLGIGLYLLYGHGILVSKHIRAALFIFRQGTAADGVMLDSCTGWARHMGRICGKQTYEFYFMPNYQKGMRSCFY